MSLLSWGVPNAKEDIGYRNTKYILEYHLSNVNARSTISDPQSLMAEVSRTSGFQYVTENLSQKRMLIWLIFNKSARTLGCPVVRQNEPDTVMLQKETVIMLLVFGVFSMKTVQCVDWSCCLPTNPVTFIRDEPEDVSGSLKNVKASCSASRALSLKVNHHIYVRWST